MRARDDLLRVNEGKKHSAICGSYSDYTPENRTRIGRYNTENGPARATKHFAVPESWKQC